MNKLFGHLFVVVFITSIYILTSCNNAIAGTIYFKGSGGIGAVKIGAPTTINFSTDTINHYDAKNAYGIAFPLGLGFGYAFSLCEQWQASIGLTGYYMYFGDVEGTVHPVQNQESDFDTLLFKYKVRSYVAMVEGTLVWDPEWSTYFSAWTQARIKPYLLFGAGVSVNRASDYKEEPENPDSSAAPMLVPFENNGATKFAYEAGIGLQRQMSENTIVDIGYRFMSLGEGFLGKTVEQKEEGLSTGKMYVHMFFIDVKYAIQ